MAVMRRGNVRVVNNTWPGFVDAMAALLLVLTFVLSIFMVVQSVLRDTIVNQDRVLNNLYVQISDLHEVLELTETELFESEMESRLQEITISTLNVSVNEAMQKIDEFKDEFKLLKRGLSKVDWDAEAHVENYYDEMGLIVDKLEILLDDEELIFGNTFDDITSGPGGIEVPITLGELYEMNMTIQHPTRFFEDL